jgi:hypothetical protein
LFDSTSTVLNATALSELNKELNSQANTRDYLVTFTTKLVITISNSIKLQASSFVQLTQAINRLTRATLVRKTKVFGLNISFKFN